MLPPPEAPARRPRVLLVEDDAGIAEVLRALLEAEGRDVDATPSGLEGVLRAARERYDLALLDIDVHDLSGLGAARAIGDLARLPLVVMSGREGPWRGEALDAGATACLAKPFDPAGLEAVVDATLAAGAPPTPWPGDVRDLSPDDLTRLAALGPDDLDALPFGAIRLDAAGRVTSYNAYEQRLAGREPAAVLGRRFSEVAPCTEVQAFVRAVEDGRRRGRLDEVLRFVFPRRGVACVVSVRLYLDPPSGQLWLFVAQRPPAPRA
ncbi:MAG: response regulator [Planctomycetes bacterium]|nr:response regulator [Planctomycetota bacterium]